MSKDKFIYVWEEGGSPWSFWINDKYYVKESTTLDQLKNDCKDVLCHNGIYYKWDYDKWKYQECNDRGYGGIGRIKNRMEYRLTKKDITSSDL